LFTGILLLRRTRSAADPGETPAMADLARGLPM